MKSTSYAALFILIYTFSVYAKADAMDDYTIGGHGRASIVYPEWFKQSFLDLREDLNDALDAGKKGIIVFFSFERCSHCKAFITKTLSDLSTRTRLQKSYDIIVMDIFNDIEVTDLNGNAMPISQFAEVSKARLTPTLIFYGSDKSQLVKIVGFYPPEKFNRVMDYIDTGSYKKLKLSQYLNSSISKNIKKSKPVNYNYQYFASAPYNLQTSRKDAKKPLFVVFDNPGCSACNRFHKRVLQDSVIKKSAEDYEAILLDRNDNNAKVILPNGRTITPNQWDKELKLHYDISVVFFDTQGNEVHRLDSETGRDRMMLSMQYVLDKGYQRHEQYLRWIREQQRKGTLRKY